MGKNKRLFRVPEDLLTYYSPYFEDILQEGRWNALEGSIDFPDDRPEFWALIFKYMMKSGSTSIKSDFGQYAGDIKEYTRQWDTNLYLESIAFIKMATSYAIPEAATVVWADLAAALNSWSLTLDSPVVGCDNEWDFIFNNLHEDNLARRVLAKYMVRRLFMAEKDPMGTENFIKRNKNARFSVGREILDMTIQDGIHTRKLKSGGKGSCYVN